MRLKVPFLRYALAAFAFLLPTAMLAAFLPFLVNTSPMRAKLLREIGSWTGAEVKIAGAVSIQDFFSLSVEARDVEIGQLRHAPSVEAMRAERIVARIAWSDLLLGNVEFDKIKVEGALFRVRAGGPGDLRKLYADLVAGGGGRAFAALHLDESVVAVRAAARKPYRRLQVRSALARGIKSGRVLLTSARLNWKGEPLTLSLRSPFGATNSGGRSLRMQFTSTLLSARFDGEATLAGAPEAAGELVLHTPNLADAAQWLGFAVDRGALEAPASIAGPFILAADSLALTSGEVTLAGQTAQAALTLKPNAATPSVEGTLAFERVDLKALVAGAGLEHLAQGLLLKKPVEADLRLSASAASWDALEFGETALTLTARGQNLNAEVAELSLFGGEIRGQIALERAGPFTRGSARISGEGLDAAGLLSLARQRDWLTGAADVNVEAEAVWTDPADMLGGLNARARVNFPEGGQMRLDLPGLASATPGEADGWGSFEFTNAAFDKLRFELTLRDGQINFADVLLASAGRRVSGQGEIDLAARSLDWRLTLGPGGDRSAGIARTAPAVTGATASPRLSIRGPWTRPVIRSGDVPDSSMLRAPLSAAARLELSRPER